MKKREVKIYCPKCEWEPQQFSRWWCGRRQGGCGCEWNTFDTGGVCPDCGKVWEETDCPACHRRSAHRAWYHEFVTETSEVEETVAVPNEALRAHGSFLQNHLGPVRDASLPVVWMPLARRGSRPFQ